MSAAVVTRSKGRAGRPWRRVRARVLRASDICWLCGLPGADTVDHVIPIAHLAPNDPLLRDIANLRPAHRGCNSRRGTGIPRTDGTSRDW